MDGSTGSESEAVDAALARLADVAAAPLAEHVAIYDEVHRLLSAALPDLDGEER